MRLITLGTGTVDFAPDRVCAGHLLEAGAVRLLLDCGSGVVHRMAALSLPWRDITHVAFSHFHADHTSDFAVLVQGWKHGSNPARTAPLTVIGPVGTAALLDRIGAASGASIHDAGFPLTVVEIQPGQTVELGDSVTLGATKVPHTEESVAYSISRGGRRVVYTGDTGYDPTLAEWARGSDVLLCECSLPAELAIPSHLTPQQCGAIAAAALPKQLVLTHFYPSVERTDVRAAVAAHYAGLVVLASDGSVFEIEED